MTSLGNRHAQAMVTAIYKTLYHLPLLFETAACWEMKLRSGNSNDHRDLAPIGLEDW